MSPIHLGEKEKIIINQRTMAVILASMVAATLAWADLKSTLKDHEKSIKFLADGQAAAVIAYQSDHEVILHIADQLKWAIKDQASHEHNPDRDMPKN